MKKRGISHPLISYTLSYNTMPYLVVSLCLVSAVCISLFPSIIHSFERKDILPLDIIKTYRENVSLQFPTDVYAAGNGDTYIADSGLQMILIFDKDLMPVSAIDKSHGIKSPMSVAVDKKGKIYVLEETPQEKHRCRISVFGPAGRKAASMEIKGFKGAEDFQATDIDIDEDGNIYLAGGSSCMLVILSKSGEFIRAIKPVEKTDTGEEIGADVVRVCLNAGHIYLLSEWRGHVYVYDRKGNHVNTFGQKGGSTGKLSRAQGLAIDNADGTVYVMDYMRHTLLIYDPSGAFINEFGGEGRGPGWFSYPKDIAIDGQGRLFVADTFNKRVQVFQTRK
ncbi:NHL repeat-containing protein [bacterium]|nr:NHL repeat-containing protein [bacterium]